MERVAAGAAAIRAEMPDAAIPADAVKTTTRHDDPDDYHARGLDRPYRALTYDYVLRLDPVGQDGSA